MGIINQYDIVLVNLDPTIGTEMKKTRPCVILSPDVMNKYLQTVVVAPMTTADKPYPTRVEVKHKTTKGWIAIDQLRTVDRLRIITKYNSLTEDQIVKVKRVIQETFVD